MMCATRVVRAMASRVSSPCRDIRRFKYDAYCLAVIWTALLISSATSAECVTVKYRSTPVCLDSFVCAQTPQSSFVRSVCYDAPRSYMLINLNGTWYHYCAVDPATVKNLLNANSVGRYYNSYFRSQGSVHGPYDCRDHPAPE